MNQKLFLNALLLLVNLVCLPKIYAQPAVQVYNMPAALVNRLKTETLQRQRGDCEQKKREFSTHQFYALNHNKLLLLVGLPDYLCHASSFMPVVVDSTGNWHVGAVLESYPTFLLADNSQQLWLASHWEIEGVFPLLHHSLDGEHWQEINLPKERNIDCCFEYIKQVCINKSHLQLKFSGMDDTQTGYWQTSIEDSLKATPNWQKLNSEKVTPPEQCQITTLSSGDWQRAITNSGEEVSFYSATHRFTVIVPRWLK